MQAFTTPEVLFGAAFALIVASYICNNTRERAVGRALNFAAIAITLMGCASAFVTYAP